MKLLLVEDEEKTVAFLTKGLREQGFVVDACLDGNQGMELALSKDYDCLILDWMLPGRTGLDILRDVRQAGLRTAVIFLTARDGVSDRVEGLESGADDYLVKPFAFSELLARIRSLLRRSPTLTPEVLKVGNLLVDLTRREASRGGRRLELSHKEFNLLALLARRAGQVLTRGMILDQVWDMNFDSDANVVDVAVRRLRRKVDDPFAVKLIRTVRGSGYALDAPGERR